MGIGYFCNQCTSLYTYFLQAVEYTEQALGLVKSSGQAALLETQSDLQLLLDSLQKTNKTL